MRRGESLFNVDISTQVHSIGIVYNSHNLKTSLLPIDLLYMHNMQVLCAVILSSLCPQACVEEGVGRDGSNLSGVSAVCQWKDSSGHFGPGHVMPEVGGALRGRSCDARGGWGCKGEIM